MKARSPMQAAPPGSAPRAARGLALAPLDGPLEAAADRAADAVTAGRSASLAAHAGAGPCAGAAPPSVERIASGSGGTPLPGGLRADMEQHFGRDFGSVRLHADGAAAGSAREIGAAAYSVGSRVVFGAGRYAPQTPSGRALIAHELAHVVQQRGASEPQVLRKPMGAMPNEVTRQATPADKRDFAAEALKFVKGQSEFFRAKKDRNVGPELKALKESVDSALNAVGADPAAVKLVADLQAAYTAAVREVITAGTQAKKSSVHQAPTARELYEQFIDDILPFALPQPGTDTGANELIGELSQPLPAGATAAQRTRQQAVDAARANLQVVTVSVDMPLENLFDGKTHLALPAHTAVRFASTVPAKLQGGLNLVAAQLMNGGKPPLKPNSTAMLALDLTPFGGGYDAYRFTRLDLGTALGTEVLVEREGAIGVEGLRAEQRTKMQERFERVGFVRGSGFHGEEFDQVLIGLAEIPETQLSSLSGLRFERHAKSDTAADAGADYDQKRHTVDVYDLAYTDGATRLGRSGRIIKFAAHAVSHEVGHAFDLGSLRTTAAASEKADAAMKVGFGNADGTSYRIPASNATDRPRFDALNAPMTAAHQAEAAARSRSGARWTTGPGDATVTDAPAAGGAQPAFRTAVLADGKGTARMPTDYLHPDSIWQEFFADAYSLFQNSPDLLRTTRPKVFDFMAREFPK